MLVSAPEADDWREARRARILDAAVRVFSERPFARASMDDVADAAGIGKPTLYRYFASKDALFAAVFAVVLDRLEDRLQLLLDEDRDAGSAIRHMLAEILPTFRDHLVPLRYLGEGEATADQSRRRVFRERRARIAGRLAAALDRGVERGEIRAVATGAVAEMMLGLVWSAAATAAVPDRDVVGTMADLLLHGLAADRARAAPLLNPSRDLVPLSKASA